MKTGTRTTWVIKNEKTKAIVHLHTLNEYRQWFESLKRPIETTYTVEKITVDVLRWKIEKELGF